MSREDFIELYKYKLSLMGGDAYAMQDFEHFIQSVAVLRSYMIMKLKLLNIPGYERARYNNLLDRYNPGHRQYLYYKKPICGLCQLPIITIDEATIDHKIPISKGGDNTLENKQIAHGKCNSFKGDRMITTFLEI